MEIFISWHGAKSHAVAEAMREWLPQIVNAFKPWLSSADIDKGARWSSELSGKLETSKAGILCLTPSNLKAEWILFEAGALSKTVNNTFVIPLLIELEHADVAGPLAQFQGMKATKADLLQLVKNLNKGLEKESMPEGHVDRAFNKWWPDLHERLQKLPTEETTKSPPRTERDLLTEIVELARQTNANVAQLNGQAAYFSTMSDPFVWHVPAASEPVTVPLKTLAGNQHPNALAARISDVGAIPVLAGRPIARISDTMIAGAQPSQPVRTRRQRRPSFGDRIAGQATQSSKKKPPEP